jgi:phosphatidylglycerophosphate synthase
MTDRSYQRSETRGSPYPGAILSAAVSAALVIGLGRALAGPQTAVMAMAAFVAGSGIALAGLQRGYPFPEFGPANSVTVLRLGLVCILIGVLASGGAPATGWSVAVIATAALALDGVDGWLARRSGLVSRYGARFDMEVDCALALVLALFVLDSGRVGAWVVWLGLARYVFWAASCAVPWLSRPLPDRRSRKAVCVVQILVLIALASPAVGAPVATYLAGGTLLCVGWSFAVDIRHLHRNRG